ncbi:hypothetical protein BGLA2_220010 [Burkholderia gladioli]|nr:hypothetical protein BGLA2_220010 [Burkholderia gladioli]
MDGCTSRASPIERGHGKFSRAVRFHVSMKSSYFRHILTLQYAKNKAERIDMWET